MKHLRHQAFKHCRKSILFGWLMLCALLMLLLTTHSAHAAVEVWDGGSASGSDWTTNENWQDGTAPVSSNTLDVEFQGSSRPNITLDTSITVNSMNFDDITNNYSIGGNPNYITFDSDDATTNPAQIINNTNYDISFKVRIDLLTDLEINNSGSGIITSNQPVDLAGNDLIISGTGDIELENTYNNSGGDANIVLQGGTLIKPFDNRINDSIGIVFDGGRFNNSGSNEVLGSMTLNSDSIIDMGSGGSILEFADFTYNGGYIDIYNWEGTLGTSGGTDQLLFGTTFSAHTDKFRFYSDEGVTLVSNGGMFVGNELVAVPEASQIAMLVGLLGVAAYRRRKTVSTHTASKKF